ncbi:conserved Plasmodium protein, unknown function [Plasmodium malariae]|uniref:Uncharacterized protein n=1 Tax=Plasmodium malariae TaxID=5858 RepID=A0A1C3KCY6_PLAMA|nr:conserved Plasmodium protein, unknown function [Plasmodium malariae]
MKTLAILLLTQILLCIYKGIVKARNIKVKLHGNIYTILYETKKVEFSELDILKIMFHSNHIKHCGNSLICYILKLSSKKVTHMDFVVRHIDVTFDKTLTYDNPYKIIGAVTNYGYTSYRVTLFGVSADNDKNEEDKEMQYLLRDNTRTEKNKRKEKNIEYLLQEYEENSSDIIDLNDEKLQEIAQKKKCINYFSVHYILVKINEKGEKVPIDDNFKNENKAMDVQHLKDVINIFC